MAGAVLGPGASWWSACQTWSQPFWGPYCNGTITEPQLFLRRTEETKCVVTDVSKKGANIVSATVKEVDRKMKTSQSLKNLNPE